MNMQSYILFTMAAFTTNLHARPPEGFVLRNRHLTATFRSSGDGPRLSAITHQGTGQTLRFGSSEEIALAIVKPEASHDPGLKPSYKLQSEFRYVGVDVDKSKTRAVLRFADDCLETKITYELKSDYPVLRKSIGCTAGKHGAYVAGVTHWMLKPIDLMPVWPKSGTVGQPAIFVTRAGGWFVTLEWPQAQLVLIDGDVRLSYRPGSQLAAGESRQVAAGSIAFFERVNGEQSGLDAARRAFFEHVASRVKPSLPFPIKFTTWGPWLGQAREDRILEIMDDLAYVGVDLLHFDAGWQQPDYPYSRRLPGVRNADAETWDREMTQAERLPNGLLPIVRAANERGMALSLWFDACGNVFVREGEEWAIRDQKGKPVYSRMWEGRWKSAPRQSLASEYGERLRDFVLQAMEHYDLGGIMFDNNHYTPDRSADRSSLASGWDSVDVQLRTILEILDEGERRRPGIYRFYCRGSSWPWALLHATHIHAGDPGTSDLMRKAVTSDYPARAMAFERRLAWQRHYDNFVPPWGIKGDIAGWSVQQKSPIPINLKHTGQLIPSGEGWTYNMFTCFATTAVRDIRFSFRQMPAFDRDILKEWLAWDRLRTQFILNCRPLFSLSDDPNSGIDGFSHIGSGRGVIYLFNRSFDLTEAELALDERTGFRPGDTGLSAYMVYPMRAPLEPAKLTYGETLRVPVIGKDCVVIEVGLDTPDGVASYADYEQVARSVHRSFHTIFLTSLPELLHAVGRGPVRLEVGNGPRDRRLAAQIVETLGARIGRRVSMDEWLAAPRDKVPCRLIIGTHGGLAANNDMRGKFRETLYNEYVHWNGSLISGPLVAALPGSEHPTFCLVAPRPEQLAQLAIDLESHIAANARQLASAETAKEVLSELSFPVRIIGNRPVLRFRPVVRQRGNMPVPGDLEMIHFKIEAEREDHTRAILWSEEIPPFCGPQWWQDRLISLADLAGQHVTLNFTARHVDGRGHPNVTVGFDRVALLELN